MARKIRCENYAKSTSDGPDFTRGIYLFWPRALSLSLFRVRIGSFFLSRSRSHRSRAAHALGIERMYFSLLSLIMLRRDVFEISRIINTCNLSTRQLQSRYTCITMNYKNANDTNKYVLDSAHPQNAIMTGSRRDNTSR